MKCNRYKKADEAPMGRPFTAKRYNARINLAANRNNNVVWRMKATLFALRLNELLDRPSDNLLQFGLKLLS